MHGTAVELTSQSFLNINISLDQATPCQDLLVFRHASDAVDLRGGRDSQGRT